MPTPPAADGPRRWRPSPFLAASAGLHGVALATVVASPPSWPLAVGGLVANDIAIVVAGLLPRCGWLGPNITRLPEGPTGRALVGLTFDDGPDPDVTPAVLEQLAKAGARATFFCIGQRARAYPDLVAAMRDQGHGVENHSFSHPNGFACLSPAGMRREILLGQDAIAGLGGGRPRFFRPPAGIQNPWLSPILARAGLSLVSWTRRGFDTVSRSGARVAARLQRGLGPGDILLLHDGSSARGAGGGPVVLDALPRLLDEMQRRGLQSAALHAVL
jgi:peptidoglycan/xylan/chitin deacetylase (PgdA/CDA1 family)